MEKSITDNEPEQEEPVRSTVRRFAQTPEPLLLDSSISSGAVRLWGIIDRTAARNALFPGRKRLSDKMGVSISTIDRFLKELSDSGWISIRRRGQGKTNVYTIHDHSRFEDSEVATDEEPEPSPVETLKPSPVARNREEEYREQEERENTLSLTLEEPPPLDLFASFWSRYPRKISKTSARQAWTRALVKKKADPAAIIEGLEANLPDLRSREIQFVPHPSTWLNQERWLDEPPKPSSRRGTGGPAPISYPNEEQAGTFEVDLFAHRSRP